jgi:Tol biopolymer transport system component
LWKRVEWAYWSPDGEFLVYYWAGRTNSKTYTYINVVQNDGNNDNCITKGMTADNPKPLQGWR